MPRQVVLSRVPVDLSIVEFNLDEGEDIFLTYTWERQEGPPIERTGEGPPYMRLIGGGPGETTTLPFGLRLGTWLIQDALRADELSEATTTLIAARKRKAPAPEVDVLQQTVNELPIIQAHDTVFARSHQDYEIVGQQGCGDLTMNAWNVAYVNDASAEKQPTLVALPQEPVESRTYSCLVKWKPSEAGVRRLTIEEVSLRRMSSARGANDMVQVRFGDAWLPRGDLIEFAVSNQQVLRNGRVVPVVTSCHQFGDLRHLIQLPNMNPERSLYRSEGPSAEGRYRPRTYFDREQFDDIWFGERAFLEDGSRNLLRAALSGPILLEFPTGATEDLVRGALEAAAYREIKSPLEPLAPGEWRFVKKNPTRTLVEVYFKRSTYGWTMVGLSRDRRKICSLACNGTPGKTGYTLEQAAEILLRAGAWDALLVDEGADVFQKLRNSHGVMEDQVPSLRRRVRASWIFARPVKADRQPESATVPGAES